jgi:outer membrane receptor protein involved in Fe transport
MFYTDEKSRTRQRIPAIDPASGGEAGEWFRDDYPTTFKEYAAFADLTFQITDRLDVQVGGRESKNRQTYSEIDVGPYDEFFLGLPSPVINPTVVTKDSSFTYLVTPRLRLSPDLMVYARLATGYRAGGPNPTGAVFGLPPHFKPDKTQNFEIGIKGDLLHRALSFDASAYYIEWRDIQLSLNQPVSFASYFANVGQARSAGVELAVQARPSHRLTISASGSWNDAVLTEDFPADASSFGQSGNRLPSSARFSGSLSLNQDFPFSATVEGFAGGSLSYVGERKGRFTTTPQRQSLAGYAQLDVNAGVRFEAWTASVFVNNATDRRGVLTGGLGTFTPHGFIYTQPRTLGVMVSRAF